MNKRLSLLACGCLLAAGCYRAPAPPAPSPRAELAPRYDLTVRLEPDSARLHASGTLLIPGSDSVRDTVHFVLHRMMGTPRLEVLEPAGLAGPVRLDSAGLRGADVRWVARLGGALPAGQPLRLRFDYAGGERNPALLFYLAGQVVYASAWGTNWYPLLDEGNARGVGMLRVQAPASHPIVIASGTRPVGDSAGWHVFEAIRPTFFSIVAGDFHTTRHDGPIPVAVYTLGPRPGAAEQAAAAARAMAVLERELGPYRFGTMKVVEYPDSLFRRLGGNAASEPGMLMLKGGFLAGPPSLPNYGHELGHNWWPIVTGFRQPAALMAEGMANYAAFRVVEEVAGPAAAERFRRSGDPGFNGEINALFYLNHAAAGFDTTLLAFRASDYPGRNMGGSKAAFVIDMLAQEVGRDAFRREMARILARHEGEDITWAQFITEIGEGTGRDLDWFREQWERPGAPDWRLDWTQERGAVRGVVTQAPPYYRATVPIQAWSADSGSVVRQVVVDGPRTEFRWRLPFAAVQVEMDPRYRLLRWTPEYRARAEALAPVTAALARGSLDALREALQRVPEPDTHGYAFAAHLSLARLLFDRNEPDSVVAHARAALAAPTRDPELLSLAYAQLALVARARGDQATLRWAVAGAIAADEAARIPGASVWVRRMALDPPPDPQ